MEDFERQLKRGTLEMLLLHLLAEEPTYGYQLTSILDERSHGRLSIKEGTLYPILYRLEGADWIAPEWIAQDRGVPRKYYRLTTKGTARLEGLTAAWSTFSAAVETVLAPAPVPPPIPPKETS